MSDGVQWWMKVIHIPRPAKTGFVAACTFLLVDLHWITWWFLKIYFQSFSETCSPSAKDPVGISHLATHVLDRWCSKGGIVFPRSEVGDSSHCDFVPCSFRSSSALSIEETPPTSGVSYTQCRFARSRATKHQGFKQGFYKFWPRIFLGYLVLLFSLRFGEAANPGPIIGSVNPTGLLGKAALVHQLPQGVYSVCESHLTAEGLCQFRKELSIRGTQMRYFSSSNAPLIRSAVGVIGGKSTGVGFLSSFPGRNLPTSWDDAVLNEARIHVSAFHIDNVWVKCGVCYGYARHPTKVATRSKTGELLAKVVDRIVFECQGPRIVMGDWNQHPGLLPQEHTLRQQGFNVEIQQHFASLRGREPSFTCKKSSIKDFIWISPELIPFLADISINQDLFPDHAVLSAHFRPFGSFQPIPMWRRPAPLPWEEVSASFNPQCDVQVDPENLQSTIEQLMTHVEQSVHEDLLTQEKPGLQPIHRGRSLTLSPTHCRQPIPPNKNARRGEINPSFLGEHFQHVQWLKQLRRMQSFVALLSARDFKSSHVEHGTALWQSILNAQGFSMPFRTFWLKRSIFIQDAPCVLPVLMPDLKIATVIFATFQMEFDNFEKALRSQRINIAKHNRQTNQVKVFNDVAMPRAMSVQTVSRHNIFTITDVSEDGLICRVTPSGLMSDSPLYAGQEPWHTTCIRGSEFALNQSKDLVPGSTVTQKVHLGKRAEVLTEFEALWMKYWGRNQHSDPDRRQPFIDMCTRVLPASEQPMDMQPITSTVWTCAVRRRKQRSATGPDGISRLDLLHMGPHQVDKLLQIVAHVETGSRWPDSCLLSMNSVRFAFSAWCTVAGAPSEPGKF